MKYAFDKKSQLYIIVTHFIFELINYLLYYLLNIFDSSFIFTVG